jgi:hypothetical protein
MESPMKRGCRRVCFLVSSLMLVCAGRPAMAEPIEAAPPGRFAMTPVGDGFLRLDTQSGAVSLCTIVNAAPQCRSGPDERAALEAEIQRLAGENATLKQKIEAAPLAQAPAAKLPDEATVDRAFDLAERFMRRMMHLLKNEDTDDPT